MKFLDHLSAHITPEWRTRYINYEVMKSMIKECVNNVNNTGTKHYINSCERSFFHFCGAELDKVDTFFLEKLSEVKRKYSDIKRRVGTGNLTKKEINKYRFDLSEFYLSLILLQNFQKLNYTGFRNILRYHDKATKTNFGVRWLENVHKATFFLDNDVHHFIHEIENLYTKEIEKGDRKKALARLRVPPFKEDYNAWTAFRIGFFLGAFVLLIVVILILYIDFPLNADWYYVIPMYRGAFTIILLIFLWSINLHVYRKYGINQILIFEIDPRDHLPINNLMELGSIFALLWSLSIYAFIYHVNLSMPKYLPPLLLYSIIIIFLLNPTKTLYYSSRLWALKHFYGLCFAPSFLVIFPVFWIGDQMNSIRTLLLDIKYTCCFFKENPKMTALNVEDASICNVSGSYSNMILEMVPPWLRFAQVMRRYRDTGVKWYLLNACKFFITMITIIFTYVHQRTENKYENEANPWYFVMLVFMVINAINNILWDFRIDWGVLQKWDRKNFMLREELVYPKSFYYFSIIENIVIRCDFIVKIITNNKYMNDVLIVTIWSYLEVFRRFIWNFFRLENEHFYNCGRYRVHRDISIRPRVAALFADEKMNEEYIWYELMDEIIGIVIKEEIKPKRRPTLFAVLSDIQVSGYDTKMRTTQPSFRKSAVLRNSQQIEWSPGRIKSISDETERKPFIIPLESQDLSKLVSKQVSFSPNKRAEDLLLLEYDSDDDLPIPK